MRQLSGILILLVWCKLSFAQTGYSPFFPAKEGTQWLYDHFDGKNELQNRSRHKVREVRSVSDSLWITTIDAALLDLEGDTVVTYDYQLLSRNSVLFTNLLALLGPQLTGSLLHMELGVKGDPYILPAKLDVGKQLPGARAELEASVRSAEQILSMDFEIKNREVKALERLKMAGNTVSAYQISFDLEVLVMVKKRYRIVQFWTLENRPGLIRVEIYNRQGNLEGFTVLNETSG